jgi:two-component system, NtrC family, nitrogen regulation sensor histidine kinase NtrY
MTAPRRDSHWKRHYERRILALVSVPLLLTQISGIVLLWSAPASTAVKIVAALVLLTVLICLGAILLSTITNPLRALANVVEAYRAGDYTLRGSKPDCSGDALGDLVNEINSLGTTLLNQRLQTLEVTALLDKLVGTIEVAILAFDGDMRLRLANPAALQLMGRSQTEAIGKTSFELGLYKLLVEGKNRHIVASIGGKKGRWQVTRGVYREAGLTQHVLIIADVRQALREEERTAWQRLIRVIGHEVNNSLAPIKSLACTLKESLGERPPTGLASSDTSLALEVIGTRADSLQRFLAQYSQLARVPVPNRRWFELNILVTRVLMLTRGPSVDVRVPQTLQVYADEDQLEQVLINLVKNAIEAQGESGGVIVIAAHESAERVIITVSDQGGGIENSENLFVPFFTTKAGGSGIGLAISRQIAEAHGGTLLVENRHDTQGAVAVLELPVTTRRGNVTAKVS